MSGDYACLLAEAGKVEAKGSCIVLEGGGYCREPGVAEQALHAILSGLFLKVVPGFFLLSLAAGFIQVHPSRVYLLSTICDDLLVIKRPSFFGAQVALIAFQRLIVHV